ncbi:hypothetical protein KY362_06920 [Candidatus Woesearchaeota archaeon]|nr:hypothetical protein [Candidatus Woesearchaeota archaeon]
MKQKLENIIKAVKKNWVYMLSTVCAVSTAGLVLSHECPADPPETYQHRGLERTVQGRVEDVVIEGDVCKEFVRLYGGGLYYRTAERADCALTFDNGQTITFEGMDILMMDPDYCGRTEYTRIRD